MSPKDVNTSVLDSGVPLHEYIFDFYFGLYYQIYHPLNLFFCSTGLVTNLLNVIILTRPAMKNAMNSLLTILAISDMVFVLARATWSVAYYIYPTRAQYASVYSAMFLNGLYPIEFSAMFSSEWFNVTIGVWRLVAVKWPLRAKNLCSIRRAKIVAISIAFSSIFINLPYVFMLEEGTYDYKGTSVTVIFPRHHNNGLIIASLYIGFRVVIVLLPILAVIGITINLIRRMYVSFQKRQNILVSSVEDSIAGINRTTMMLTILLFIFIFTNTPSAILFFAYYAPILDVIRFRSIFLLLQTVDKFTTFCVYFFMSSKFRATFRSLLFTKTMQ